MLKTILQSSERVHIEADDPHFRLTLSLTDDARGVFVRRRAAVCAGSAQFAYALREAVVDGVERMVEWYIYVHAACAACGLPLIPDTAPRLE